MSHHRTKYELDGSVTEWESEDGNVWRMTKQTYPPVSVPAGSSRSPAEALDRADEAVRMANVALRSIQSSSEPFDVQPFRDGLADAELLLATVRDHLDSLTAQVERLTEERDAALRSANGYASALADRGLL